MTMRRAGGVNGMHWRVVTNGDRVLKYDMYIKAVANKAI